METTLLALAFSFIAVIGGSFVLLVVALIVVPRLRRAPAVATAMPPDGPQGSVIIAHDYELEAKPERTPVFDTPAAMPAITALGDEDSFEDLFQQTPPSAPPRANVLSRQLERVSGFGRTAPLPIPIAPPGVEPIPELEPTQLIMRRPEWALDWP